MTTLYAPQRSSRAERRERRERGPELDRKSKYAIHDEYILHHYSTSGPTVIAQKFGIPPNAVVRRYQRLNGIADSRRRESRANLYPNFTSTTTPISLPKITLDR